jgi:hypothetical protein
MNTICVTQSRAAGMISLIAKIDLWSIRFRPLPSTTFYARLPKPNAFSVFDGDAAPVLTCFMHGGRLD